MTLVLLSITASVVVGVLAVRHGTDSRPIFNEEPEAPGDRRRWI